MDGDVHNPKSFQALRISPSSSSLRYSSVIPALNVSLALRQRLYRLYTLRCNSVIV